MIPRRCTLLLLLAAIIWPILVGCGRPATPTPAPLPWRSASPTASPEGTVAPPTATPQPTVQPQAFAPGRPTPVPILYKMFDYGTDFQNEHPEYGPVGSMHWTLWERVNPGPGAYDWSYIDDKLALEAPLKVTLLDGREIPKPVVIQVFTHLSSAPNWNADFYDGTPRWVYDRIDRQQPGDRRPVVGGRPVGYALTGCGKTAVLPMYDNQTWREAHYAMIRAFGARYNDHPQVTAVMIATGLDAETQIVKDWGCQWNSLLDEQASAVRYNFGKFMNEVMQVYQEAFPNKPLFINNAPGGSGVRKATSDYAATFDPPIGLKHCGLWVDNEIHRGYGNFVGAWDMINAYSMTLPIWLESVFGLGSKEHRYWTFMAGLHYHPDAIDLHPEFFTDSDPEWLRFVTAHLGVTIKDTPDVWTVLRDAEFPLNDWTVGGASGHPGDWTFWLYRRENAPQSATQRIMREEMPAAKESVYSRQARRTRQDENHIFMSFDIDDAYPYVAQKPLSEGGDVHYLVHVTLLNRGDDTFSLQYRDWDGGMVTQTVRKGPKLGPVDDWVVVTFVVENGYLDNNMPGGCDFRISCERDGDEYIHMVRVEGGWGPAPTPTPIPPTRTPTPTPTGPTPTPLPPPTMIATPTIIPGAGRFVPEADTYLDAWSPKTPRYDDLKLSARHGDLRAPLLRFNLSTIPPDAVVNQAVLSLYVQGRSNDGNLSLTAHKVLRPWIETECTWEEAQRGQPWALAGCNDPVWDRSPVIVAGVTVSSHNQWVSFNLTALVQDWIREPEKNHGVVLKASGSASVEYSFYSVNYHEIAYHPHLWVAWREGTPSASPTPTAFPTPTRVGSPTQVGTPPATATLTPTATPSPTAAQRPTSTTLRQGERDYTGVFDTYLDAWAANLNTANESKLSARQGSIRVPLIRYDLSMIPSGATVTRAVLNLYVEGRSNQSALKLGIAKVVRPWDPASVSWYRTTATEAWAQAGAREVGVDRSVELYASGVVDGQRYWTAWDITRLAGQWVQSPATNHGLLMVSEGSVSVQYDMASSEAPREYRPYLEIEYIPTGAAPTPTPTRTPTAQPPSPAPTVTLLPALGRYVFQQGVDGYSGCEDTYVDAWNPQANSAFSDKLSLRQGGVRSALIRFDIRALPAESYIQSARLVFYVRSQSGSHALPVRAYNVLQPWRVQEATYQRASRERAWYKEGLNGVGRDISVDPVSSASLTSVGQRVALDVTSLAREWVSVPEHNHGVVIKAEGAVAVEYTFYSADSPQPALRPQLEIEWRVIPPSPTPTRTTAVPTATPTFTATPTRTPSPTATRPTVRLVLQQGVSDYDRTTDTRLDAWNQTAVFGREQSVNIRQTNIRVALIRFGLEALPADAKVTEAILSLWATERTNASNLTVRAYLLRRPWNDKAATWLEADTGLAWALPGANGADADRAAAPLAALTVTGTGQWVSLDVTDAVRRWAANPQSNHGLLLRGEGPANVDYRFAASEHWDRTLRPKLTIVYAPGPQTASRGRGAKGPSRLLASDILPWLVMAAAVVILPYLTVGKRRKRWGRRRAGRL